MATIFKIRRDTAANWSSNNPTLSAGEMGLDQTNNFIKMGDGSTAWNSLAQFTQNIENVEDLVGAMVTSNTETFITVTYDDSDGTLDFVVPVLDEDAMGSNSATNLATQQSIKAYVDAQITAADLDFIADSGGALSIDLDSETLTIAGGTGIDTVGSGNGVTASIDSTVATLTGSQTLTNKTLTSAVLNTGVSGTAIKDQDNMSSNSATHLATQQSIKAYVDAQDTASDLDFQGDSGGALSIDLDSEVLDIAGGTGIDTTGSGNEVSVAIDSTVTTLTGSQTLTNKTLTSPVLGGTVSIAGHLIPDTNTTYDLGSSAARFNDLYLDGSSIKLGDATITASGATVVLPASSTISGAGVLMNLSTHFVDEDNMSSNSATKVPSQQSVKAYIDSNVTAQDLDMAADSGTAAIDLDSETLTVSGTANQIATALSGNTLTVSMPDNVTIAGNLTVAGTQTTVSSTTIEVADPLLFLATSNNAADAVDIGVYGLYDTSGSQDLYGGIYRDASDSGKWKIFKDNQAVPTTTVNTSGTGYAVGTLVADVEGDLTGTVTGAASLNLLKTGGAMTGAITTNSTFDGVDIAVRDAILTSTTTTADAALPKAGGAMTGAITTNSTFDGVDIATRDAILTSTTTTAGAALPKAGGAMTGAITTNSTFDTRDVATDGTKLDTIETNADVTDATNVNAAGALMLSDTTTAGLGIVVDEDNLASDLATKVPTQQSVKAYVDAQVTAQDLDLTTDSGTIAIDLDSETLSILGGTGLASSATGNAATIAIDSTVTTLTGTQTLTNKTLTAATLTSPVLNTGVSGSAVKDEDNMASNSATHVATQQSIKAYVDGQTTDETAEGSNNLYYTAERFDDRLNAVLIAGTNLTATYDDAANTYRLDAAAAGGYDLSGNDTDDLSEGSTNLYHTTARARGAISVTDAGGDGSCAYNSSTGVITYTGPSASEVRAHISVTDSGGDGSLAYSAGVITYTGPSAAEVRAHISAGTGVAISNGAISIGQAVATDSDVTFDDVVVAGNLTVNGTTTTVATTNMVVSDKLIELANGQSGTPSGDLGLVFERGSSNNTFIGWDESADEFTMGTGTFTGASTGNLTITLGTLNIGQVKATSMALTGAVTTNSTFDGRDVATDGAKLDLIEASATADQTGAQIKAAYEAESSAFTDAQFTKLAAIEAAADVTDATNVNAAGAVMLSDTAVSGMGFYVDEDNMASNSATKFSTQQSIKAYVDGRIATVDALDEMSGNIDDIDDGSTYVRSHNSLTDALKSKLDAIEAAADVTDATNVEAAGAVMESGATASAKIPSGTTAQRDGSPSAGFFRWNTTETQAEIYDGSAWSLVGGGNTTEEPLWEHESVVSSNYVITDGNNALSCGPIIINSGYSVTVGTGSSWAIV
jgi:hypothetical protein